jgi:hypothetical protein
MAKLPPPSLDIVKSGAGMAAISIFGIVIEWKGKY